MTGRRRWPPAGPVIGAADRARRDDPKPLRGVLDDLLGTLGAPPVDVLAAVFDRWPELAGTLADHSTPVRVEGGVLTVAVTEPGLATEWRYRQGDVLRRCDRALGEGVVNRVEVRVRGR